MGGITKTGQPQDARYLTIRRGGNRYLTPDGRFVIRRIGNYTSGANWRATDVQTAATFVGATYWEALLWTRRREQGVLSYDERQLAAVLVRCSGCGKEIGYMTNPVERCATCRS